jgi:hypothetical protein
VCGKNARFLSKEKGDAASQIRYLRLAPNHWVVATMQHPRGGKIMTSKRRKLPNRRSCFLFRIEGYDELLASEAMPKPLLVDVEPPVQGGYPFDALDAPDQSKNAYPRDVLKGILTSLAAVFVKASARLVARSAKACICVCMNSV